MPAAPSSSAARPRAARLAVWETAGCMLVVGPPRPTPDPDDPQAEPPEPPIWGYVVLNAVPGAGLAWIAEVAVAPDQRRRGLGQMLLGAARAWARAPQSEGGAGGLAVLMVELSPRNYPAIAFVRGARFHFAGYTDYTLAGGDLRLFFIRPTD